MTEMTAKMAPLSFCSIDHVCLVHNVVYIHCVGRLLASNASGVLNRSSIGIIAISTGMVLLGIICRCILFSK